jgi:hypothetical protein
MNSRHSSGRIRTPVLVTALSLCLAVFAWGLQYKLSLYDHPGNRSNSVATAKLLSQEERTASSTNSMSPLPVRRDTQPSSSSLFAILAAMALTLVLLISSKVQAFVTMSFSCQRRFAESVFFFFRPPPILFLPK